MTDRYNSVIVTFDRDIRSDDAEPIINALKMISGVVSVDPVVSDMEHHSAKQQALHELRMKLWDCLK